MTRSLLGLFYFVSSITTAYTADDFKPEPGFTPLINGKDLSGWKVAETKDREKTGEPLTGKTESPTKRFTLTDGVLVIDPKVKGDITITTERTFDKDAHIKFDFKPGKGCNNDLYFRGTKFDLKTPDVKNLKEGEWNSFEIIVKGDTAEFRNNGEVIKSMKVKGETGLGIRAEFGPIEIRRLRVQSEK